jgi:hypothetical protein
MKGQKTKKKVWICICGSCEETKLVISQQKKLCFAGKYCFVNYFVVVFKELFFSLISMKLIIYVIDKKNNYV